MATVHPLPANADVMCCACLHKADQLLVLSYSSKDLKAVCQEHISIYGLPDNTV